MPQIEVTFDIDANGILNVSAKDKATGKEQKIVIKASSGLSEDEIKRMVRDAEAHAEEDRKFRELADARNQADALVHATEKALRTWATRSPREERAKVESALRTCEACSRATTRPRSRRRRGARRGIGRDRAAGLCAAAAGGGGAGGGAGARQAAPGGGKDDVRRRRVRGGQGRQERKGSPAR